MNDHALYLEEVKHHVEMLPPEQRAEVAELLKQIQTALRSASCELVASATLALFGAINNAAMATAREMANNDKPH